jgi:hypothetical protein
LLQAEINQGLRVFSLAQIGSKGRSAQRVGALLQQIALHIGHDNLRAQGQQFFRHAPTPRRQRRLPGRHVRQTNLA